MLRRPFILVIATAMAIVPSFGALSAPSSLVELATSADLIISGSVSGPVQSGSVALFNLTVNRVVKGEPGISGNIISVRWEIGATRSGPGLGHADLTLPANTNGLWFLRSSATGWLLVPAWQGAAPFAWTFIPQPTGPLPSAYLYDANSAVMDKVAAELGFGLENMAGGNLQFEQMELGLLDALNSDYVQTLYERLSASPSAQQQIRGLAGSIRRGSAVAMHAATTSAKVFASYPIENQLLLLSISNNFRASDPASITALGRAAISPDVSQPFREASAHALAAIHTTATLSYLATLLDDSDDILRIEAIGGLSSFANGLSIQTAAGNASLAHLQLPATAPYKTSETVANFAMGRQAISQNETKYLSFWKSWWSQYSSHLAQ